MDCIIYTSPDAGANRKNRGFCFLDFCDHKAASDAKRKIHAGKVSRFSACLKVIWRFFYSVGEICVHNFFTVFPS